MKVSKLKFILISSIRKGEAIVSRICFPTCSAFPAVAVYLLLCVFPAAVSAESPRTPVPLRPAVTLSPQIVQAPLYSKPPALTPEEEANRVQAINQLQESRRIAFKIASDPLADPTLVVQSPQTFIRAPLKGNHFAPLAPGDFTVYRNTTMIDAFTNDSTSSRSNEPSTGMNCETVFYSGNWYACVSSDGGRTFSFLDPEDMFPVGSAGFCCDQQVNYDPSRDLMFWYLQGARDGTGNNMVLLAVSTSNTNTQNNIWNVYQFTAQDLGYPDSVWLDFPDLSVSNDFLYVVTNILPGGSGSSDRALLGRIPLVQLDAGGSVTMDYVVSNLQTPRPTHGPGSVTFFGQHVDDDTVRIYEWADADAAPSSVERDVDSWYTATSTAPSPDGSDWVAFDSHWIIGAWVGSGRVGFMWGSAQGGIFPWPHVRYARFRTSDLSLTDQGQIWNSEFAFAYPCAQGNDRGDAGGTLAAGGGGSLIPYPILLAWIADDYNGDTVAPLESVLLAAGDSGPTPDRWGDFFTARRSHPYGNTWLGTGFVNNGGMQNTFAEPHWAWFGREADTPGPPTITCPSDITVECSVHGGTPADDPQLAVFFGGVSASDVCGTPDITNDAPAFFYVGETTEVTFTATTELGFSNSCSAMVTVVDTTPPVIICPADITVECTGNCGVEAGDDQLIPFFGGVSASDLCDSAPLITNDAPSFFEVGSTPVTFTAVDDSGNASSCTAVVTVVDTTPPEIDVTLNRYVLWPPNHKLVDIEATVTVTDVCDPNASFFLASITSNEPDDGLGDGDTENDIQGADFGTADTEFQLRSERSGTGDGRIYTIVYTAYDACDTIPVNTTDAIVYVYVPHDKSGHANSYNGFSRFGDRFASGAREFELVVFSTPELDASQIDWRNAQVGNTEGAIDPKGSRLEDLNLDGLADLILTYSVKEAKVVEKTSEMDNPLAFRYGTVDGTYYLVPNIFRLGP